MDQIRLCADQAAQSEKEKVVQCTPRSYSNTGGCHGSFVEGTFMGVIVQEVFPDPLMCSETQSMYMNEYSNGLRQSPSENESSNVCTQEWLGAFSSGVNADPPQSGQ